MVSLSKKSSRITFNLKTKPKLTNKSKNTLKIVQNIAFVLSLKNFNAEIIRFCRLKFFDKCSIKVVNPVVRFNLNNKLSRKSNNSVKLSEYKKRKHHSSRGGYWMFNPFF